MYSKETHTVAGCNAEADAAPDERTTFASVMPTPPRPFMPEAHCGQLVILALSCYAGFPLRAAHRCDLLKENVADIEPVDNRVTLEMGPYQIVTLRLIAGKQSSG